MRRPPFRFLPLLVLLTLLAAPAAAQQRADLVLLNGRVFTADPLQPWAEAVAIRDGRIVEVGSTAELRGRAAARVVDVGGRVVIPGINDAHMHVGPGDDAVAVRLGSGDPSLALLADSIGAALARTEPGTWIVAAIGETILGEAAAARALLDRIAPAHPVRLEGWTGHGVVMNAAGLRSAGIDMRAPDPAGGWYERAADGSPVAGWGYAKFAEDLRSIEEVPDSVARAAIAAQAAQASTFGITTMQAMPLPLVPARMSRLAASLDLPVRIHVIGYGEPGAPTAFQATTPQQERLYAAGVKWFADGTPIERNAMLTGTYADRSGWHGRAYLDYEQLRAAARAAAAARVQPVFHASGDSTIALIFRALREAAPDSAWRRLRPRIEHGDFLRADQLDEARALGVVLVQNPAHLMTHEAFGARVGARMPDTQLLASVRRAGVSLALGSDGPVNPFLNIMFTTMHPGNPAEALTREEAVTAYTYGSSFAEGVDDKGMIAVGMLADLAVLSQDIFTIPAQALPGTTSVLTIVGGDVVHDTLEP